MSIISGCLRAVTERAEIFTYALMMFQTMQLETIFGLTWLLCLGEAAMYVAAGLTLVSNDAPKIQHLLLISSHARTRYSISLTTKAPGGKVRARIKLGYQPAAARQDRTTGVAALRKHLIRRRAWG